MIGGRNPRQITAPKFDLTRREGYSLTTPLEPVAEPEEPDVRYVVNIGLKGPTYSSPTDDPLTKGKYYLDIDKYLPGRTWKSPSSPLYLTKGQCGIEDIPIIDVPETATTVELVINNLSPAAVCLSFNNLIMV